LIYIEHAEPAFRPIAFAFGTAFHEAVGAHLSGARSHEDLVTIFRDNLTAAVGADGPPVLFDEEEADLGATIDVGARMLEIFVAKVPRPERVLGVEVPFALELAHPITGEVASLPVIGAIDALVQLEEGVGIWEVKTGKRKWSADQLEFDLQPTAYRMAARSMECEDAEATLLVATKTKTPDVQIERLVRHARDERELAETALTVIRATEAGIDHRVRGWACKSCPYADACGA
jgi:CRISPR/Cas system-associated exonuclease Cas4 (RecB family)